MEPHWTTVWGFWITGIVCVATLGATVINMMLYRSQTDPEVIVYTNHDLKRATIISLVIENIGKGVAHDIRFTSSEPIPKNGFGWGEIPTEKIEWMSSGPLINGIPSLQPGGKRQLEWGQFVGLKSIISGRAIAVKASYNKRCHYPFEPVEMTTISLIDISSYENTVAHTDNEPKKIREELANINKTLKSICSRLEENQEG